MIHLHQVTKLYAGATVLRDIDVLLPAGSYAELQVDSEASSNTLFQLLLAYQQADSGKIYVNHIDVSAIQPAQIPFLRRTIGFAGRQPNLANNRTVRENIALPLHIAGFGSKAVRERINQQIRRAKLGSLADTAVEKLARAEQQLVSYCRALSHQPDTVLTYAPDSDSHTNERVFDLLEQANSEGATVLVASCKRTSRRDFSHRFRVSRGTLNADLQATT